MIKCICSKYVICKAVCCYFQTISCWVEMAAFMQGMNSLGFSQFCFWLIQWTFFFFSMIIMSVLIFLTGVTNKTEGAFHYIGESWCLCRSWRDRWSFFKHWSIRIWKLILQFLCVLYTLISSSLGILLNLIP